MIATGISVTIALAACGGGSAGDPSSTLTATGTTSSAVTSERALTASSRAVSAAALGRDIDRLYDENPQLNSYLVQGTTYTPHSREIVLHACTTGSAGATTEEVESRQLVACAPLIFFLYSYGAQRNNPQATRIAGELLSFASDEVRGPYNATSELTGLLRAWGIKINAAPSHAARSKLTPRETALLAEIDREILSQASARVTILGYQHGGRAAEQIVVNMSRRTSTETITQPAAHAAITLTGTSAFLSGNARGLTKLIGLPSAAAHRAGSHWVKLSRGSQEYADLAAEDTLTALPASILPGIDDSLTMTVETQQGRPVDVLVWRAPVSNSTDTLTEHLEVTRGADPLPIEETTTVGAYRQTASFSNWGMPVAAVLPRAQRGLLRVDHGQVALREGTRPARPTP